MTVTATWTKPGPGTWELDSSHAGPAPGPIQRDLYERCIDRGMTDGLALFGAPLRTMHCRFVNGKFYRRLVPLIGGDSDRKAPPAAALWLATRVHPAFRRAEKRAEESFETKRWRAELARWESEWKPDLVKANLRFTDVDVAALDDAALADHLCELHEHLVESTALHFRLHVSDMGPLGDLMVKLEDWGLHRDDTFRALVAASPATREPRAQLRAIAGALRAAGVDPTTITSLGDVRAEPAASAALDEYLRFHGWRLTTGYDIEDRVLLELPDVIVASIRGAREAVVDDAEAALASVEALRDRVPAAHRADFDDAVEDARLSYGLRDENGPLTYEWPAGLLRRALLEADRRIDAPVFELTLDEVASMLRGETGPSTEEIAARAAERRRWATLDAPARLGPEEAPPPVSAMPPNLARITRVVLTVVGSLEADEGLAPLHGMGIGTETYVGTARVVHDAVEALATMEPGDIVVAEYTAPTYNSVLSMAGAIVTEQGGLLCHAAVIARELGIPAVIGATDAMSLIPDGARIEVDPTNGRVTILS
ncbi:MAG TPA: PEP-utilizing enzyme [Acidimicrobiales bacterium]|nr:PEP-utilizing enzyme [Acidimicrobiales bacterium]